MTIAEDIQAAATEIGASAQAAAERVTTAIADLRGELEGVRTQLQEALDADTVEKSVLQTALDGLSSADAIVDSIEAAPAEEEPTEEPPVEEPPPDQA